MSSGTNCMQLLPQLSEFCFVFNAAGEIMVTYQPVDFGHGKDVQFLSLSSSQELQHTANQLRQNTPNGVVTDNIRDDVDGSAIS